MAEGASGRDAPGQDTKEETQIVAIEPPDLMAGTLAFVIAALGVALARSLGLF